MTFISITQFLNQLLQGTLITISIVVCALLLGFILAIVLTLLQLSEKKALIIPAKIYIFIIRGTPLLIQFFIIYYGLSQFASLRNSFLWDILRHAFPCAVIALAFNTAAYTSVLLCGAIRAIPIGEIEACKALGMSWFLRMRHIILPRAFRIALPAYSNEIIMVLKGSALASTITLLDIMGVTQRIISETYASIEFLLLAGCIYFCLNAMIIFGFRKMERMSLRMN